MRCYVLLAIRGLCLDTGEVKLHAHFSRRFFLSVKYCSYTDVCPVLMGVDNWLVFCAKCNVGIIVVFSYYVKSF